jgi:hypothetical protein
MEICNGSVKGQAMKKGQTIALLAVAGVLGGAVSSFLTNHAAAAQAARTGPAVVRTSKLELVDQAGKVRATMAVDEASGQAVLRFTDPASDAPALVLSVGPDGRTITLTDPQRDKPALQLSVNPDSKTIVLYDKNIPIFGGEVEKGKLRMFGHEPRIVPCN